jgi:hypothetical protein
MAMVAPKRQARSATVFIGRKGRGGYVERRELSRHSRTAAEELPVTVFPFR